MIIQLDREQLAVMSKEEREHIAAFILNFPSGDESEPEQTPAPEEVFSPSPAVPSNQPAVTTTIAAVPAIEIPATPGVAERDSKGLPWDSRIHSSAKSKNEDGSWRLKRGVDKTEIATVENQLRQLMSIPVPAATVPAPPAAPAPGPVLVPSPPAAAVPAPPAVPAAPPVDNNARWVALVKKVTQAIQGSKVSQEEIATVLRNCGVESLSLLPQRLDLVPTVDDAIDALLSIKG